MRNGYVMGLLGLVVASALSAGCGGDEGPYRKETHPVVGQVLIDGKPVKDVAVKARSVEGLDQEHPTVTSAFTDEEGRFELSTYESGDGIPEGEYVLTFVWGRWNSFSMSYGGPDKLKGRYNDPEESNIRFTVEGGEPIDLGKIELSTSD